MTLKDGLNHFLLISLIALFSFPAFTGCSSKNIEIEEDFSFDEDDSDSSLSFLFGELSIFEKKPLEAVEHFEDLIETDENYPYFVGQRLLRLYIFTKDFDNATYLLEQLLERDLNKDQQLELLRTRSSIELSQKDLTAAKASLEEIIALTPKPLASEYLTLTSLFLGSGETKKAENLLTEFVSGYPNNAQAKLLLSNIYIKSNRNAAAERLLKEVSANSVPKGLLLTRSLLAQGKTEEAKETLSDLSTKFPNSAEIKKIQSKIALKDDNPEQALSLLQSASELEADSFNTRVKIALVKLERQRFLEAETDLLLLVEEKPESARVNYFLALAQVNASKPDAALETLGNITSKDKNLFRTSKTLRADLFRRKGDFSSGATEIAELIPDHPEDLQLLALYAYFQRNAEDLSGAAKTFEKIVNLSPTAENYYSLATLQDEIGKPNKAIEFAKKALEIEPRHANAANFVAYLMALKGTDLDYAKQQVEIALTQEPKNGYFLDTLAWIHYAAENYLEAYKVIKDALEYVPHDGTILKHYGQILERLGKNKRAKGVYLKAKNYTQNDEELSFINNRLKELKQ